jgi:murein DD-endopeptidase MepM/ murein hydrolase activator NlpD
VNSVSVQRIIIALVLAASALAATTSHGETDQWFWPVTHGTITSGIGWRNDPILHTRRWHNGVDIAVPTGTRVHASGDGVVYFAGWWKGFGNLVVINHGKGGFFSLYAHCKTVLVREGDKVKAGGIIALSGSTGHSSGPHLHWETRVWKEGPKLKETDELAIEPPAPTERAVRLPKHLYEQQVANLQGEKHE